MTSPRERGRPASAVRADPAKSAASARGRGRPALARTDRLDRQAILDRAHAIVDADGLEGLTMRRLAADLGVTSMAIYYYLPNKKALLSAMIDDVFAKVVGQMPAPGGDPDEWIAQCAIVTRRVWLQHLDLVNLSMAVAPADDALIASSGLMAAVMEDAGYPDVPLASGALQNFLLGSIATWANRRLSSTYFGRDPDQVFTEVEQLLDEAQASENHRGLLRNRFDQGDEENFEPALRALLRGLRTAPPRS